MFNINKVACVVLLTASLKIKADKEREVRDAVCKQLVDGKRTIGTYMN